MIPIILHIVALMEKIEKLEAENARYREALEFIKCENKKTEVCFNDQAGYWRDQECQSRWRAGDALEELK